MRVRSRHSRPRPVTHRNVSSLTVCIRPPRTPGAPVRYPPVSFLLWRIVRYCVTGFGLGFSTTVVWQWIFGA